MSTPVNFLFNLASAIATQEGFFRAGTRPQRNNNPGDLRAAPWLSHAVIDKDKYWLASSRGQGIAGLYHQIALCIARGESLRQLIHIWAPPTENNTDVYLANVAKWLGITNLDEPLWNHLDVSRIQ